MKNIEVEARSFIDDEQYRAVKERLDSDAGLVRELDEVTVYFSGEKDLRMRKNASEAFVILKEGKLHDDFRKELEIRIDREDFDDMAELFRSLGHEIEIEWHRKRLEYKAGDMKVLLDDTEGYGKILELERMAEEGQEDATYQELLVEIGRFGVNQITPKEEFNQRFEYYKHNWRELISR